MGLGRDFSLFRFNVLREMTAKLSGSRGTPYDRYVAGLVQIHFEVSKCMYMIVTPRQKLFYGGNPIYMM